MLNQDIHKNLRRNKGGIHLDDVRRLSPSYIRPPGFMLVPSLLGSTPGSGGEPKATPSKNTSSSSASSYYQHVKEEMQRYTKLATTRADARNGATGGWMVIVIYILVTIPPIVLP